MTFTPTFAFLVGFFRGFRSVHDGFGCWCHCHRFLWEIRWWCSCLIEIRHLVDFCLESFTGGFVMCCVGGMCFQILSKLWWFHFIMNLVLCVVASSRLCLVLLVYVSCYCPWFLWLYPIFVEFNMLALVCDFRLLYYPSHSLWLTLDFLGLKEPYFLDLLVLWLFPC